MKGLILSFPSVDWLFLLLLSVQMGQSKPSHETTSAERFYKLLWAWIKNCNSYLSREAEKGWHLIATGINFLCLHSWLFFLSPDDYRYCILGLIVNFPTQHWSRLRCATFPPSHNHHWAFPRSFGWFLISPSSCLKCNKTFIPWAVLQSALELFIPQLKLWLHLSSVIFRLEQLTSHQRHQKGKAGDSLALRVRLQGRLSLQLSKIKCCWLCLTSAWQRHREDHETKRESLGWGRCSPYPNPPSPTHTAAAQPPVAQGCR